MQTSNAPKKFMIPYVEFPCPNCEHRLRVKYEYLGGKLRCKYCAHEFVSPSADEDIPWASTGPEGTEDGQAAQRRVTVLETELGSLREELASRTAEHTAVAEKFQQAQQELRHLQDQIHQAWADQRNAADSKQELWAAQSELQSVREELAARMAEFTATTEKFQHTQDELRRLQEQVHQAWADQRNAAELNQKLLAELEYARAQALSRQDSSADPERLLPEHPMAGAAVDPSQPQRSSTVPSSGAFPTRTSLLEQAQNIRAQLEASSSIKEQIDRLSAELTAAQADKERLSEQWRTAEVEATQLRQQIAALEQSLAELTATHTDTSQALQQGQAQWETERQALQREWEERLQSHLREAEQRLEEAKTRIESDRSQWQEQHEAVRQKHEQESAVLQGHLEQLRQEHATLRAEHDASLDQIKTLGDEHNRITAERDEIDIRHKDAVEGFRADMARLTQAWQESRQQETVTAEQNRALTEQLEKLHSELDQQRSRETEHQERLATIQQAAEAARAEAAEEKARTETERQKWQQLDDAQRQAEENNRTLQSEVERLREEVTALQEALAIVGVVMT